MQLGSGEHYGWERPRTARLVAVLAGPRHAREFAWVRVPEEAKGGPLEVMVRRRGGDGRWVTPPPGQRVDVAAWFLSDEQVLELEIEAESGDLSAWAAPKPLPDSWLWLRG